jgi:hypothetical protein
MKKKPEGKKKAKKGRGRPAQGGVVISAVGTHSQMDDLDAVCLAIRRVNPDYRIRRSELMRGIFEAAIPILKKCDWRDAKDYESLVSILEKRFGRGR